MFVASSYYAQRHHNVINKTIVYSDTVLPLKDIGNNLKVTTLYDVSEYSLASCLRTIFESNPNVIFNTVQYSKNNKKVYFYTNAEISTKEWEDRDLITYKPITSSAGILEEVKSVLVQEKCMDSDSVSLYDVISVVGSKHNNYKAYEREFERWLEVGMDEYSSWRLNPYSVKTFNYKNNELEIGYNFDYVTFVKVGQDLVIKQSKTYKAQDLLAKCGEEISKFYDRCLVYRELFEQSSKNIKSSNSNFLIDIDKYEVSIFVKSQENRYMNAFELSADVRDREYNYRCNSNAVISAFREKESEIFKRIFIRIEDCPEWTKTALYEIRQKQLAEEMKQQKRLALKRKIFPFLKK